MTRQELVETIQGLVGQDAMTLTDVQAGWPALAEVNTGQGVQSVALFASLIGLSHRGRDDVERRFQNPSGDSPIAIPPGRVPVLVGLWSTDEFVEVPLPVLAAANAGARAGRETRFSVFVRLHQLQRAATSGWEQDESTSGETIYCLHPVLLPVLVEARANEITLSEDDVRIAVEAAGIPDLGEVPPDARAEAEEAAAARVRRATSTLVRDARFSRDVIAAYEGLCALCGLDLGLVQGAHIYPVGAPGSRDEVWNGIALCNNHHAAFDRHMLWIHPETRAVSIHPAMLERRDASPAGAAFIEATLPTLREPLHQALRPRSEMFAARYDHYSGRYEWLE